MLISIIVLQFLVIARIVYIAMTLFDVIIIFDNHYSYSRGTSGHFGHSGLLLFCF